MKKLISIIACLIIPLSTNYCFGENNMYDLSKKSCVKVISQSGNSSGSGFFIGEDIVATCFHVIANITVDGQTINWSVFTDLKVITSDGQEILATCISLPNATDSSPLIYDFAILKLVNSPNNLSEYKLELSDEEITNIDLGEVCYFSGYPLAVPTMITQQGNISGIAIDKSILCIQGSINKGNSGGGLINEEGKVIGIVSMREGGISKGLQDLTKYIESTANQGSVRIMGVDPLQAIKATVETLNTYISTGIGYAREIKYLKEYCENNNVQLGS